MVQSIPLPVRLALLVAGTTLPLILFAAGLIYVNHVSEREAAFDRVLDNVRTIQRAMDTEIRAVASGLEVLGGSAALRRGDMEGFRGNVQVFLRRYPAVSAVSLARRDGTQIYNSRVQAGEPLPPRASRENIEAVFQTGRPAFSNIFVGSIVKQPIAVVSVPVFENETVAYEIGFNPPLQIFQALIERPGQSDEWTVGIFDRTGTSLARVPNPQQTIGQKASPTLLPALLEQTEGKLITTSLEGVPLLTAFTRSPLTGWTVAAGIPVASVTAPLWRALAVTASIGVVMLAIGLVSAIGMAKQIAHGQALQRLLLNELNHRVKNTLAIVQSVATQTFRRTTDPAEARRKFDGRLVAIGRTHALLSDEKWDSARVHEIVHNVFMPYVVAGSKRLQVSGPDIRVAPRCAMMLSLALHELATNAAKYGALANDSGQVSVVWERADPNSNMLKLSWTETGGPSVQPPSHRGFGSRLIEEAFPHQLQGSAALSYDASGVSCTLVFSIE